MLKIFLSGHTNGVGAKIYDHFSRNKNVEIAGGSRTNGYDIGAPEGRKKIIQECKFVDIIILNAHDQFFQSVLLFELFESYRTFNKKIFVMGSDSGEGIKGFPHRYAIEKKALKETCHQLQNCHSALQISLITPGWIKTDRTKLLSDEEMLNCSDICDLMDFLINRSSNFTIKEIYIEAKKNFSMEKIETPPW